MVIAPASTLPARPEEDESGAAGVAARVASGPGFWTGWLAELDRQGLLEELLAEDVIARALREAPPGHKLFRRLHESKGRETHSSRTTHQNAKERYLYMSFIIILAPLIVSLHHR